MDKKVFHHALKIQKDICFGCSHCMNICPTEAIRVENGKAILFENKCIDCGCKDNLEIHHIDYSWDKIGRKINNLYLNIDKVKVLCKDCHKKEHNK